MGATRIQSVGANFANATSARTFSLSANVTAGNFIAVSVITFNSGITVTVSDSLGNTYSQAGAYAANGSNRASIWYATNITGGACTVTVTPSATAFVTACVVEYSGVAKSSALDNTSTANGSSTTPNTGSVPVAAANELIIFSMALSGPSTFTTARSGACLTMSCGTGSNEPGMAGDATASSAVTVTLDISSSTSWAAVGASFNTISTGAGGGLLRPASMSGGF